MVRAWSRARSRGWKDVELVTEPSTVVVMKPTGTRLPPGERNHSTRYGSTTVRPDPSWTMFADWKSKSAPWNRRPVESVKQLSTSTVPKHRPSSMCWTRNSGDTSSSWLPMAEKRTPSLFRTSIVGSSWKASTSKGQPAKLSPVAKVTERGRPARNCSR